MQLVSLVGIIVFAFTLAACGGFECQKSCKDKKEEILMLGRAAGSDMPDQGVCNRYSLRVATTCEECRDALKDEYGIEMTAAYCD